MAEKKITRKNLIDNEYIMTDRIRADEKYRAVWAVMDEYNLKTLEDFINLRTKVVNLPSEVGYFDLEQAKLHCVQKCGQFFMAIYELENFINGTSEDVSTEGIIAYLRQNGQELDANNFESKGITDFKQLKDELSLDPELGMNSYYNAAVERIDQEIKKRQIKIGHIPIDPLVK